MAIFIKNLQFLSSRRLFSLKNRIFHSSEASETSFFAFFTHPSPRKRHFSHFSLIRGLGNVIFRIFHSSEPSETSFFAFFAHPRPRIKQKPRNLALTTRRKTENPDRRFAGKQAPPIGYGDTLPFGKHLQRPLY